MFTAHGSEHALAGFMAIIDAMMSFVKDRGDSLHSMRSVTKPSAAGSLHNYVNRYTTMLGIACPGLPCPSCSDLYCTMCHLRQSDSFAALTAACSTVLT